MMPRKLFIGSISNVNNRNAVTTYKIGKAVFPAKIKMKTTVFRTVRPRKILSEKQTYQQ